ncbi:uncharacterized protein LOC130896318 [Diorhabda carinulata]|uniref:uncharacterized protein LOC130896318 n=1 Tax=Diorhabda carinulata TaxID=1163345 RepID=UPI0025A1652F|nr:uncharacterized protein LOC130896318 [Diorhabda carinulata]
MRGFEENNCRLCKNVFCCKGCREKHETKRHNVFPACEICITGKIIISSASQIVIEHIKLVHWPLHCLFCKRLFGSVEELFQHIKCPLTNGVTKNEEFSPYTPSSTTNYSYNYMKGKMDLGTRSNVAASTPMQQVHGNNAFKKISEVIITPVDSSENINEASSLKRRVTFCETPITESLFSRKSKNQSSITDSHYTVGQFFTPSATSGSSTFYSAMGTPIEKIIEEDEEDNIVPHIILTDDARNPEETQLRSVVIQEKMVWINAINVSSAKLIKNKENETSIELNVSENQFFTPMVPKKKINIVAPSIIQNNDQSCFRFDGPVQTSSTPNNSKIPAPNVRDVFKSQPSTSKSDFDNWNSEESTKEITSSINSTENSLQQNLWSSVTKLVKNVFQGFSASLSENKRANLISQPLKRYCSDQDLEGFPIAKRYKVADVQCRRTIRDMTPINKYMQSYRSSRSKEFRIRIGNNLSFKTFVDKATQTDDYIFTD